VAPTRVLTLLLDKMWGAVQIMRWYNTDKNDDWLLFTLLYYNLLERFYKLPLGTHNLCAWKHLIVQMRFHLLVKQNHNNPTVSCSFLLFKLIITGSTPPISVNLHRLKGNNNCETGVDYGQCLNFGQSDPATLPVVWHRRQISIELFCSGKACCAFELY